jgi:hypothetical protein
MSNVKRKDPRMEAAAKLVAANQKWGECDPRTVAPINTKGVPDLRNYLPTRNVTMEEAQDRGWTYFFVGDTCRWGHRAPRLVSNPKDCVDCSRIRGGQLPLGVTGSPSSVGFREMGKPAGNAGRSTQVATAPSLSSTQKLFLEKYVATRDFAQAAKACGHEESRILSQLSFDKQFREAVQTLEADNGLSRTPSLLDEYEWTEDKRRVLLRRYIDTGDLLQAMRDIGVSNYEFERHLTENPDFVRDLEQAEELVTRHWDRYAANTAGKGSERILQKYLAAIMPDKYGEKTKIDLNVTRNLSHEQLAEQVAQQLAWLADHNLLPAPVDAIDGEFTEADPQPAAEDAGDLIGFETENREKPNCDLV